MGATYVFFSVIFISLLIVKQGCLMPWNRTASKDLLPLPPTDFRAKHGSGLGVAGSKGEEEQAGELEI